MEYSRKQQKLVYDFYNYREISQTYCIEGILMFSSSVCVLLFTIYGVTFIHTMCFRNMYIHTMLFRGVYKVLINVKYGTRTYIKFAIAIKCQNLHQKLVI